MRTKKVNGVTVNLTQEENDARDAEEAAALIPEVPKYVTRYQAMTQLHRDGLRGTIAAFLGNPGNEEAQIAWEDKEMFERDSQFIADLAPALGLTDNDLDQLFINAAQID